MPRLGAPAPLLLRLGCSCRDCGGERGLLWLHARPRLLLAGVFSLAGLRRRGVLGLRARLGERVERPVDSRPRLRARLGERVDPPNLQLLVLLSREELLSRRGET